MNQASRQYILVSQGWKIDTSKETDQRPYCINEDFLYVEVHDFGMLELT